jgi:hypothetical protein
MTPATRLAAAVLAGASAMRTRPARRRLFDQVNALGPMVDAREPFAQQDHVGGR